ncbi:MAG: 16S rRNA (cytosine(1402)-N(4))-methyltransferase RsmH [bacterium]
MEPRTLEARHDSVLLPEVLEALRIEATDVVVDATVGGAGHFKSFFEALGPEGTLIGIDADAAALKRAKEVLAADPRAPGARPHVHLVEDNFRNLPSILDTLGIERVDKILFDLGWSGFQLAENRGFSFQADEPLLMAYGSAAGQQTAAEIVNGYSEEELADLIYSLGEERFARGIAKSIVTARREKHLLTTADLVHAVELGTPAWYQHRRTHPATKTFQALRIAVNDELGALRDGLSAALSRAAAGGRIAVITFHSIEDRIVKSFFKDAAHTGQGTPVTRKPVVPSFAAVRENRRARSAKLRVFEVGVSGLARQEESLNHAYA